jgi:hypothetical protein
MRELTPAHVAALERLLGGGFTPAVFPLYPDAIAICRGSVSALLEPEEGGGLRLIAPASYLLEGNFSVRIRRDGREWFVWKSRQVEATPERLEEVAQFSADLSALLSLPPGHAHG